MAHRKPKVWFDHDYLSSLDDPDAPGELFFLSEPSQQVLSQLAEMVLWTNTRWFNGSAAEVQTLAWRIYEELKVPLHLDDLIPHIDEVETLLTEIRDKPCCGSLTEPVPYGDSGSDIFPYSGPAPLPDLGPDLSTDPYPVTPQSDLDSSGTVDQTEWEDYVCGASNFVVDALIDWFDFCIFVKQANIVWNDALQALLPIIARYVPGTIDDAAVIAITLAQDAANAFQSVTTVMLEDGKAALIAERDALNCAMRGELTSTTAANAFLAVLSGAAVDAAVISLLQTGPMIFFASMIWNAAFDHDIDYDCQCEDPTPTGYHLEAQAPTGVTTANNTNVTSWSYDNQTGAFEINLSNASGSEWLGGFTLSVDHETDGYEIVIESVTIPGAADNGRCEGGWHPGGSPVDLEALALPITFRGYHTGNHSGAEWDTWVGLADYTRNYNVVAQSKTWGEYPHQSAITGGGFQITGRMRFLKPD